MRYILATIIIAVVGGFLLTLSTFTKTEQTNSTALIDSKDDDFKSVESEVDEKEEMVVLPQTSEVDTEAVLPTILYSKRAYWGPCSNPDPNTCKLELFIYDDGQVLRNGVDSTLSKIELATLNTAIDTSGLIGLDCSTDDETLDYSATYLIKGNEIRFPSCDKELRALDEIVDGLLE